jgi:hypothetical protein
MWYVMRSTETEFGVAMSSTNLAGHNVSKGTQDVAWYFERGSRSIM